MKWKPGLLCSSHLLFSNTVVNAIRSPNLPFRKSASAEFINDKLRRELYLYSTKSFHGIGGIVEKIIKALLKGFSVTYVADIGAIITASDMTLEPWSLEQLTASHSYQLAYLSKGRVRCIRPALRSSNPSGLSGSAHP